MSNEKLREIEGILLKVFNAGFIYGELGVGDNDQESTNRALPKIIALIPDMELLKKQIEGVKAYAFSESLFGDNEHQLKMDAMVSAYDVVLNLIKEMAE